MSLQKWGGISAIIAGFTYVFGFAVMLAVLVPNGYVLEGFDPAAMTAFTVENSVMLRIWNLVIFVVNAIFLVVLAVAIAERLSAETPALAQVSKMFGVLWATLVLGAGMLANVGITAVLTMYANDPVEAERLWVVLSTVENGLGGGNEIAGGVWALLLGLAMLRGTSMPKSLGIFSLVIGIAGLSSIIPFIGDIGGSIFGLGFIAWFIWTGIVLLRRG